ncbi:MAG: DUF1007 family protein, partial [Campylobacterota bacterium]|nr:DUF1007 family protein [Campylobacterota bacterium]
MVKKIYLLLVLFVVTNIFAHPHTFIEVYPTIKVKNGKTTKINFKWILDEMTSSMLIMEFDKNNNTKIDENEKQYIYNNYFVELKNLNFYTDIKINGKVQFFPNPINFKATIKDNKICYSFDIETSYDIDKTIFDFGDEDFFVAMLDPDIAIVLDVIKDIRIIYKYDQNIYDNLIKCISKMSEK